MTAQPVRLWRFLVPPKKSLGSWGLFVVGSDGFFSCVTDYGNWAFRWTAMGCDVRKFLQDVEPDYLVGKLTSGQRAELDPEATVEALMEQAKQCGFRKSQRAKLKGEVEGIRSETEFVAWFYTTDIELPGAEECMRTRRDPQCMAMATKLMPRLAEMLKESLDREP